MLLIFNNVQRERRHHDSTNTEADRYDLLNDITERSGRGSTPVLHMEVPLNKSSQKSCWSCILFQAIPSVLTECRWIQTWCVKCFWWLWLKCCIMQFIYLRSASDAPTLTRPSSPYFNIPYIRWSPKTDTLTVGLWLKPAMISKKKNPHNCVMF